MKITDFLNPSRIILHFEAKDKPSAIENLVKVLVSLGELPKEKLEEVVNALLKRETSTSTGLGYGVAVPHIKTNAVSKIQVVFGRNSDGLDFEALDGNPSHFFFLVLAPAEKIEEYLKVLSCISALMKEEKIRQQLLKAASVEEVYKILDKAK